MRPYEEIMVVNDHLIGPIFLVGGGGIRAVPLDSQDLYLS